MISTKVVCVQGLGFVGSAMAIAVASKLDANANPLYNVIGIDKENDIGKKRIESLSLGKFPFNTVDSNLQNELSKAIDRGNLSATCKTDSFASADIVLVSINCDLVKKDNYEKIAIENFISSLKSIAENITEETLVIIESTVPPGTCEKIIYPLFKRIFVKRNLNFKKFYLAHSYERVMPGKNYFDSIINYWRVYAGINKKSTKICGDFLSSIIDTVNFPLKCLSSTASSETGKLLENSYRAVNIALIEEWSRFAEEVGIDLYEVIDAIRMRPTHSNIRQPGFGVGGYCLTKDPLFAKIGARDLFGISGHNFPFSTKAIEVNNQMPLVTLNKLKDYFNGNLSNRKLLLMGVSYRQDVDDTRHSPSELFVREAQKLGAQITAYDPLVEYWHEMDLKLPRAIPDFLQFDVVIFAVPHVEFQKIGFTELLEDQRLLIYDANKVLSKKQIKEIKDSKMDFQSIGRG